MILAVAVLFCLTLEFGDGTPVSQPRPIVLWHGMGDTCCNPLSMGSIKKLLEAAIPGVNVTSLMIGSNVVEDLEAGFFNNINDQIDFVCNQLKNDPTLQGGYHGIGFSQGGLFLRGLAERCPSPPLVNLISVGGPQQGVYGLPRCSASVGICDLVRKLLHFGAYSWIQNFLVQAEYWHDPLNEDTFKEKSVFLADINCELEKKAIYKENLLKLSNLVLVMFTRDTMVQPKESEWFGFYKEGQAVEIYNFTDSKMYSEDWIGLKQLNTEGRLHLLPVDGDHLQFSAPWFVDNIVTPFLSGK